MKAIQPIGIFDSGIGGLTIWKEIHQLLPNEATIYLADSVRAPYGDKPKEEIVAASINNTNALIKKGCKIVVVACNTATTNAISILREKYSIPFVGIEPATKPAAINTITGKIGILATRGTLASELFLNTSKKYRGQVIIIETIGEGLVPLIESGNLADVKPLLIKYLTPMIKEGVDNIVLGCTHYPFLIPMIRKIIPEQINIIDTGKAVAQQTHNILSENGLLNQTFNNGNLDFYTNADVAILSTFLKSITNDGFNINFEKW